MQPILPGRDGMVTRDAFEEKGIRIISSTLESIPENKRGIIYRFRIQKNDKILTKIYLDYHPEINSDKNGTFFLERSDPCGKHFTLKSFTKMPSYEEIKEEVVSYVGKYFTEE